MKRYWLGLAIWGAGLVFIWWLSKGDWQLVSAVATWFLVLGVAYAFLQVQQARRSTNAQLAMDLYHELRCAENVNRFRFIYGLTPKDIKKMTADNKKEVDYTLDRLEMLGALVLKNIVDQELAIEVFAGLPALRCWYKLCVDYIGEVRKERGYYAENYEAFTRLSLDHFNKADMQAKLRWNNEQGVDLLAELQKDELRPRSLKEIKRDRKTNKGNTKA